MRRWFGRRTGDDREQREKQARLAARVGLRHSAAGRHGKAVDSCRRAVELAPHLLEVRVNLGSVAYLAALAAPPNEQAPLLDEAASQFRHVLGLQPDHVAASLNLAATLNARGESAEALALLEALARRHPRHRDVHYNLGVAYLQAGRAAEAVEQLASELEQHPDHRPALELLKRIGGDG